MKEQIKYRSLTGKTVTVDYDGVTAVMRVMLNCKPHTEAVKMYPQEWQERVREITQTGHILVHTKDGE